MRGGPASPALRSHRDVREQRARPLGLLHRAELLEDGKRNGELLFGTSPIAREDDLGEQQSACNATSETHRPQAPPKNGHSVWISGRKVLSTWSIGRPSFPKSPARSCAWLSDEAPGETILFPGAQAARAGVRTRRGDRASVAHLPGPCAGPEPATADRGGGDPAAPAPTPPVDEPEQAAGSAGRSDDRPTPPRVTEASVSFVRTTTGISARS